MKIEMTARRRLMISSLVSVLVAAGLWFYLAAERRRIANGVEMAPVLMTRKYIAAGKAVTADAVSSKVIPRACIEPGAVLDAKDLGLAGGRARVSLLKGQQVTRSTVELAGGRPGLAWVVPPGLRAIGLRLPPEHLAAGHLNPGDRADVLAVPRRERTALARTLVKRARVLSVGERVWDPAEVSIDVSAAGPAADTVLISLLLSPADAARVAAAAEQETLLLALASPLGESGAEPEAP